MNWLRKHYGHMYMVVGGAHILLAIAEYRDEWADLFRDGFIDVVGGSSDQVLIQGYWFTLLGPALIAIGSLAQSHLDRTGSLPRTFCLIIAAMSVVAGLAALNNGIWAVGALGLLGLAFRAPTAQGQPLAAPAGKPASVPRTSAS